MRILMAARAGANIFVFCFFKFYELVDKNCLKDVFCGTKCDIVDSNTLLFCFIVGGIPFVVWSDGAVEKGDSGWKI